MFDVALVMKKSFVTKIQKFRTSYKLIKGVRKNIRKVKTERDLSREQEAEIKEYYKTLLGIDIPLEWHRYFYKRTGVYSVRYIPTSLYYTEIIGKINQMKFERAYSDKNLTDHLLKGIKFPETVLKNLNGYFYLDGVTVDKETAISACSDLSDVIIKPTLQSHGVGVKKFSVQNGITSIDGESLEHLFDRYKSNFIIQKVVHQHELLDALNPSSVNTIRILTYRSGMEVLVPYTVIRIGRQGWDIDNETAGGISTRINRDGTLAKYAYGSPGNDGIEKTDSGIVLDGYKIPTYEKAVETVKKLHLQLPHFNLIGWDISIDTEGEPVLIEWNVWPELSQSANGPAFGEYTERILKEIWNRPNTMYK